VVFVMTAQGDMPLNSFLGQVGFVETVNQLVNQANTTAEAVASVRALQAPALSPPEDSTQVNEMLPALACFPGRYYIRESDYGHPIWLRVRVQVDPNVVNEQGSIVDQWYGGDRMSRKRFQTYFVTRYTLIKPIQTAMGTEVRTRPIVRDRTDFIRDWNLH